MEKIKTWVWQRVANPLAVWLAKRGLTKSRLGWRVIYAISPNLAGLTALLTEASAPHNTLYWWYGAPEEENSTDELTGLLEQVSEVINRAPTPFGMDDYKVFLARLGALPGDGKGLTWEQVDSTLEQRPTKTVQLVEGNRWHDWKHGNGEQEVRAALEQCRPQPDLPVTIIQVAVVGSSVASAVRQLGKP